MRPHKEAFAHVTGAKPQPNARELALFARAQRLAWWGRYIPGLECLMIGNSLAMYATHEESDIDLFIVVRPNRLWIVRLGFTALCALAGMRKTANTHAGQFCLSFFVDTEATNIETFKREPDDIYLFFWTVWLKCIWSNAEAYENFLAANAWASLTKEEKQENMRFMWKETTPWTNQIHTGIWESMLDSLEKLLIRIFKPRTLAKKEALGNPEGIVVNSHVLKFHNDDRRHDINARVRDMYVYLLKTASKEGETTAEFPK